MPDAVADPKRPSGGNTYDRHIVAGLRGLGWEVRAHLTPGSWPDAGSEDRATLAARLRTIPDGQLVLVDGLIGSAAPEALVPEADRLRLAILVHLPLGVEAEGGSTTNRAREYAAFAAARTIVATSTWTRAWLAAAYDLPAGRVAVVPPGVDPAHLTAPHELGNRLLCVGAVTPVKGQDVLVEALASILGLDWSCVCVGSTAISPGFAADVRRRAADVRRRAAVLACVPAGAAGARRRPLGCGDVDARLTFTGPLVDAHVDARLTFTGPLVDADLDARFAAADLVIVPSRMETYGMVVTEALARGIPVVASDAGGLPETLGRTPGGDRPERDRLIGVAIGDDMQRRQCISIGNQERGAALLAVRRFDRHPCSGRMQLSSLIAREHQRIAPPR